MPGHIKKTSGPDPDPSPWLLVSYELKQKLKQKPYDPKKSVWVPNKADGGFLEGLLESKDGNKCTVNVGGEMKTFISPLTLTVHLLPSLDSRRPSR